MKLLVRIWLLACLCFALYQNLQPEPPIARAQFIQCPTCCYTYDPSSGDCQGENPCNHADYAITAGYQTGAGLKSWRYETVMCDIPGCGSVDNVHTAVDNPYCCDVDDDDYNRPGCGGGTDCNDENPSVHPGATEICGDGIDNDCSGGDASCCVEWDCRVVTANVVATWSAAARTFVSSQRYASQSALENILALKAAVA